MYFLLFSACLLCAHALAGPAPCPTKCDVTKCASPRAPCTSGRALDRCGCCALCAAGEEGATCGRKRDLPCASGLECARSGGKRSTKGVCRCKSGSPVCGSDGKMYENRCRLEAASRRAEQRGNAPVTHVHKDRCTSAAPGINASVKPGRASSSASQALMSKAKMMGKVIFYEDRNFGGRSYECSGDCSDMFYYMNRCHSCRVESGCWMVYDRPNFMGNQYFIKKGEYADYMGMWGWGMNNWIRSCRMIPMYQGSYRMRVYDKENFMGQMMEMTNDCDSFMSRYNWWNGCMSCHVMDGHWLMYEHPNYRGKMWYFRPGEYRSFRDMMRMGGMRFMSMRRIMDSWY